MSNLIQLDFAITSACNLMCKHCYQAKGMYSDVELNFEIIQNVLVDAKSLNAQKLVLTGGEPLTHSKFKDIIILAKELKYDISLYSNGQLFNDKLIKFLNSKNVKQVQISVEGFESEHDEIRGEGSFKKIIQVIPMLVKSGIIVKVNTQVSESVLSYLDKWIDFLDDLGVSDVNLSMGLD